MPTVTLKALHSNTTVNSTAETRSIMPVKSLHSPVIKWPDLETVLAALVDWALEAKRRHVGLLRLGYFGSYARGDWGVGSDLDKEKTRFQQTLQQETVWLDLQGPSPYRL